MWIFDNGMRVLLIRNNIIDLNLMVSNLIDVPQKDWKYERVESLFYQRDMEIIVANIPVVNKDDIWCWQHNKSGDYTVRSGYWLFNQLNKANLIRDAEMLPSVNDIKAKVWTLKTAPKIRSFLWRVMTGAISVNDRLQSIRIKVDPRCQPCGVETETINHVLFSCSLARHI